MAEEEMNQTTETEKTTENKTDGKKKSIISANLVEILVAVFLGITAILTAWASWISSLHGGNQSTNYTKSNNLASEGNAEYIAGMQLYLSDLMAWNTMVDYYYDEALASLNENYAEVELIEEKRLNYRDQNCSQILLTAFDEMTDDMNSPFEVEGVYEAYYESANILLEESRECLEEGKKDNANGDAYNLVSVIYSVVLFMLGIVGVFKKIPNRAAVLLIAVIALILTTIYMCTIPMPTGFSLSSFFS